ESRTENLVAWVSQLRYDDLPRPVVEQTKELFLDWLACPMAGKNHPAISVIDTFVQEMGPAGDRSEIIHDPDRSTSQASAAFSTGPVHTLWSKTTCMIPPYFGIGLIQNLSDGRFPDGPGRSPRGRRRWSIVPRVVGYYVACRTGEYLGGSHYQKSHTTATAGVVGAAATAAYLLRLDPKQMLSTIGTAGTQAAGWWQFLLDALFRIA
ncbi:2-methylcitrate dehydratase PrpD, partial [Penicillium cinerascens]